MNYTQEQIKYCIECGKPFATYSPQQKICSRICQKNRTKRLTQHKSKTNYYKNGILELSGIKDIDLHKQKFRPRQKVTVHQTFEGKKSGQSRRAKIVECYDHFAVCQLKHYRESFAYVDMAELI